MAPLLQLLKRAFDPNLPAIEFSDQWRNPSDVFSVLLILGGDVVARALAQVSGSKITPVAFSFGWVAYIVSAVSGYKLMPPPDYPCKVINGRTGYVRDNAGWIIGRIMRDYESWMDGGQPDGPIRTRIRDMQNDRRELDRSTERNISKSKPVRHPLCVSVYRATGLRPGHAGYDRVYYFALGIIIAQLAIAAIPCGLFGDWGILLVTACGIMLSVATGSIPQWSKEKWACRGNSRKTFVLVSDYRPQHAIVILGDGSGPDLEDLATPNTYHDMSSSFKTRVVVIVLAILWILLLITATGLKQNTWFLLAVGSLGMLQNIVVAAWKRSPDAFGIPLQFVAVIMEHGAMNTLYKVEEAYPRLGRSMRETFFPVGLRPSEDEEWQRLARIADEHHH